MEKTELLNFLKNYINGTYINAKWKSVKEINGLTLVKESNGVIRMGVAYSNLAQNKEKVTQGLPYGEFEIQNILIKTKNGYQVRVYPSQSESHHTATKYTYGGVEYTKKQLLEMGVLKESKKTDLLCFNIKLENLIALG